MRITALFDWPNEQGVLWYVICVHATMLHLRDTDYVQCVYNRRDVLRASARQEFEEARHEQDPEIVNRLLVVGRDAVHQVAEKFLQKRNSIHNNANEGNRQP